MTQTGRPNKQTLAAMTDEAVIALLAESPPDAAPPILRKLTKYRRGRIKATLARQRRETVAGRVTYSEDLAGGLMSSRYADLDPAHLCGEALKQLAAEDEAQTVDVAFVVNEAGRLIGTVTLRNLLRAPREARVGDIMERTFTAIPADMKAEDAARIMAEAGDHFLPVVDAAGVLLGIVSDSDMALALEEAGFEDMQRFTAVSGADDAGYFDLSIWRDFLRRAPWIFSLAVIGLMSGYVVHVYEDALDALVILALYMPMVADTGGNVGTQTAGLLIRAIATKTVTVRESAAVLWRELRIAVLLALLLFAFAMVKVVFISNQADVPTGLTLELIAFAIGLAICVQVITAGLIGALLPIGAMVVRQDPAVMAGPALTTIIDLTGLMIYFGITTMVLGL